MWVTGTRMTGFEDYGDAPNAEAAEKNVVETIKR